MSTFGGSIPDIYDDILVPMTFEPFAEDLAARVSGDRIVEIAAGTGIVTRKMAARLPNAHIVATDLSQPMLDRAAAKTKGAIEWRQADALVLPFEDGAFDVAVCQFGVMFFPDRIACYREARRVAGRFVFNTWDALETHTFEATVIEALAGVFPDDPPRFLARVPHGYCDSNIVRADLEAAGFTNIAIENVQARARTSSARNVAIGYCHGSPLRNEIDPHALEDAVNAVERAVADRFGRGAIEGSMAAWVITAS